MGYSLPPSARLLGRLIGISCKARRLRVKSFTIYQRFQTNSVCIIVSGDAGLYFVELLNTTIVLLFQSLGDAITGRVVLAG